MLTDRSYAVTCRPRPTPVWQRVSHAFSVWRQRQHLEQLDDAARKDLGLSDADIAREHAKPIWDVPAQWRKR